MPRQVTHRLNRNPTPRNSVGRKVSTNVVASPVDTYVAPGESEFANLNKALSSLEPGLNKYYQAQQAEQNNADMMQGAKDRLGQGNLTEAQAKANLSPEQSAYYQKGYMIMHGRAAGAQASTDLVAGYEQDKENLRDPDAFNTYVQKFMENHLQGMNDPDVLEGFMSKVQPMEAKLRNQYQLDTVEAMQTETKTNLFADMKDTVTKLAAAGATPADLHTEMQYYTDWGHKIAGISRKEMSALQFEAVNNIAMETGRPELFDVFGMKKPDGTPGLANSPAWSTKIQDARAAVQRHVDQAKAKHDDLTKYEWRADLEAQIKKGIWDEGHVKEGLKAGIITDDQALSYHTKYEKQLQAIQFQHQVSQALDLNNTDALALLSNETGGKKVIRDTYDSWVADTLSSAGNDPQAQADAIARVGKKAEMLDMMPTVWEAKLKGANPANPKAFDQAAMLYQQLDDNASLLLHRHLSESDAMVYEVYQSSLNNGADHEAALQDAHNFGSPDKIKPIMGDVRHYMAREGADSIKSDLLSSETFGHDDIKNKQYVIDEVTRIMGARMALGQTGTKDAYEYAIKRFKANHHPIAGRWVRTTGIDVNDTTLEAANWYLDGFAKQLKSQHQIGPDDTLYINSDAQTAKDGTVAVYSEDEQRPIQRVSLEDVLAAKVVRDNNTAQAERVKDQKSLYQKQLDEQDQVVRNLNNEVSQNPSNNALRKQLVREAQKLQDLQDKSGMKPTPPPKPKPQMPLNALERIQLHH